MLTNKPAQTPDDIIVKELVLRYSKFIYRNGDLNVIAMLRADDSPITYENGKVQFSCDAIALLLPDDEFTPEPQHAHFRIDLEFAITLVPCPDSH